MAILGIACMYRSKVRSDHAMTAQEKRSSASPSRHYRGRTNGEMNRLDPIDRPIHDWYRFVLSFPPHLVRHYIDEFRLAPGTTLLDPFCGTGTALVEAKKHGINTIGIEANPMAALASRVKTTWNVDGDRLVSHARAIASAAEMRLNRDHVPDDMGRGNGCVPAPRDLPADAKKLLLKNSISPLPLHKALVLLDVMQERPCSEVDDYLRVALAKTLVFTSSNLHFGPEVGVRKQKPDAAVIAPWLENVELMAEDLASVHGVSESRSVVHDADSRTASDRLVPGSVGAVITSPPYPNEKDYTRTTRLETVLLGFATNNAELRRIKKGLVRSNTRGVYKTDDDDRWAEQFPEVIRIASEIEARRIELGKTSGFERMYHRVTKLYFGGMARHLADLRPFLKPGAMLAYVVGDQASYLRVLIRTGELLADISESLGYERVKIELFRTRLATATKEQLREETVILRWPG